MSSIDENIGERHRERNEFHQMDTRNNRLIWPANRGFEALALF
jgi:hypothetical protein